MPTREERLAQEQLRVTEDRLDSETKLARVTEDRLDSETKLADAFERLATEMSNADFKKPSRDLQSAVQNLADELGGFNLDGVYDEVVEGAKSQVSKMRTKFQEVNAKYATFLLKAQSTITDVFTSLSSGLEKFNAGESLGDIFMAEAEKFGFSMDKFNVMSDKLAGINVPEIPVEEEVSPLASAIDGKDFEANFDMLGGKESQKKLGKMGKLNDKVQKRFGGMPKKIAGLTKKFAKFIPIAGLVVGATAALIPAFVKLERVVDDVVEIIKDLGQIGFDKVSDGIDFFLEQMSRNISGEATKVAFGATAASLKKLIEAKDMDLVGIRNNLAEFAEVSKIGVQGARDFTQGLILLGKDENEIAEFQKSWMNKLRITGANAEESTAILTNLMADGLIKTKNQIGGFADLIAATAGSVRPEAAEGIFSSLSDMQSGIMKQEFSAAEGMLRDTFGAMSFEEIDSIMSGSAEGMGVFLKKIDTLDTARQMRLADEFGVKLGDLQALAATYGYQLGELNSQTEQSIEQMLREDKHRKGLLERSKDILGMIFSPFLDLLRPVRDALHYVLDLLTPWIHILVGILRLVFVPIGKILSKIIGLLSAAAAPMMDLLTVVGKGIGEFATKIGDAIDNAIDPLLEKFREFVSSKVVQTIIKLFKVLFVAGTKTLGWLFMKLWAVGKPLVKFLWILTLPIRSLMGFLWKGIKWFVGIFGKIGGWLTTIGSVFQPIINIFVWVGNSIKGIFSKIINGLIDFASKIPGINKLLNLDQYRMETPENMVPESHPIIKLGLTAKDVWTSLKVEAAGWIDAIKNPIKDAWTSLKDRVAGWIDAIKSPFQPIINTFVKVSNSIRNIFAKIVNGLIDFASKIPGVNKLLGLEKHRMEVPESLGKGHIRTPEEEQLARLEQLEKRRRWQLFHKKDAPKRVLDDEAWADIERFTMPYDEKFNPQYPFKNSAITDVMELKNEIPITQFTAAPPASVAVAQQEVAKTEKNVDSRIADKANRDKENELLRQILVTLEADRKKAFEIHNRTSVEMDGKEFGRAMASAAGRQ